MSRWSYVLMVMLVLMVACMLEYDMLASVMALLLQVVR